MRKTLLGLLLLSTLFSNAQVVISQVYGAGGNSGSTLRNDFIEIFNRGTTTVNLTGWSVQYAATTGTSWQKTDLSGSIAPGQYYLVQEAQGTGGTQNLPTPDAIGTIAMAAGAGKVALLNTNVLITSGTLCPSAGVQDIVGYGTGTNCFEGSGPTPPPTAINSVFRASGGCTDNNNNAADFTAALANPRNTASPTNPCAAATVSIVAGTGTAEGSATPGSLTINFSTPTSNSTDVTLVYTGTANFGTDYTVSYSTGTVTAGVLTVPAGTSSVTVNISAVDDPDVEGPEGVILTISNPSGGYTLGSSSANITIADNDVAGAISVAAGGNASEPATAGSFTINFTPTTPSPTAVTVAYAGLAAFGTDYSVSYSAGSVSAGVLTVPSGTPSVTVTITPIDDPNFEGTESISLSISNPTNNYTAGTASASIDLLDNDPQPVFNVVINQVYGGGGNSGSTYKNDFIELFNNENFAVNLAGWSVQYASSAGTTWQVTNLNGTIPPHGFYLVQESQGSGGTTNLPAPDAAGTILMAAGSGKVILCNTTTAQSGASPSGVNVIDKVGYGSANGFETAPTALLDNGTSAQRSPDGFDTNNNSTDFIVAPAIPRNSTYTTAPPVIVTLSPPNNSVNVPYNIPISLVFDKPVQKGTGNITFFENGVAGITIDVASPDVVISNNINVAINTLLAGGKSYYVQIDAGAFKDVFGNNFVGINNNTTWSFTTYNSTIPVTTPATFNFQNCTGSGLLPDGFTQYSIAGALRWDCTPFGRDPAAPAGTAQFPNAVQMNGFANGTNVPNIDWIISPSIDLTGTTFPLLSFWSRTAFNGAPLQLKVSTDYVSGDPSAATWTDINGKFPAQTSNIWALSDNINLSAFKQANVHFAFIYSSTDEDGARWTLDDIQVINSAVPPPPSLTVSTTDIQFPYVAGGSHTDKTFTFIGNDLVEDVTLNSTGDFLLSKDGSSFSSSIVYTSVEANNINETVFVRFAPTQNNQDFTGAITVATSSLSATINLRGTSIDPATTLEVVNWNMEWFGSTDPTLGPTNDPLQEQNAKTVLQNIGADIFALVEVVDESRLANIVSQMPGYTYKICNYGSHTNVNENNPSPVSEAQKEAFVYKTSIFSNVTVTPLLSQGINTTADLSNPAYNYWSSGRFPFMMSADVTLNCVTKNIKFVLCHAKANTSPTATSYQRRKQGADTLYFTLNQLFPNDNIIVLGDLNDDLDKSITAGFTTTSWNTFTDDPVNFTPLTLPLSLAGKKSTVSFNDVIDHVIASNEMTPFYMPGSANILNDVANLVSNYGTTTSDHFPAFTRYKFELPPAPVITCGENIEKDIDPGTCGAVINYNAPVVTGGCGTIAVNQTSGLASGAAFPAGTTTNTFVVTDAAGGTATCSFTVTVRDTTAPVFISPVDIVEGTASGVCGAFVNYEVVVSDNCDGITVQQIDGLPSGVLYPGGTTINTFVARDPSGNTTTYSFKVTVTDNRPPLFTRPPNKTIPFNGTCSYDASTTVTGDVTDEQDNCSSGLNATYTDQVTQCGNNVIIARTWTLTDANGNTAPAQVQTITVTDNSTNYIVYATKEARFGDLNLINGSVGVTDANGKVEFRTGTVLPNPYFARAKNIAVGNLAFVPNKIFSPANDGPNPPFFLFAGNTSGLTNRTITASTTVPVSANYKELKIKKNVTVTITGTLYGKIDIEEGAQVTFTPNGGILNIENLNVTGRSGSTTRIKFGACTSVRIKDVVTIGEFTQVNVDGPKVTFYLGDNNNDDEQFIVQGSGDIVSANIYIKKGKLSVNGDVALMKGWFIAERVVNEGKLVVWNSNDCNSSSASRELVATDQKTKQKEPIVEDITELTVTASPNPSSDYFRLRIQSKNPEPVKLRILDLSGKLISMREGIPSNSVIETGSDLKGGMYFVEVIQGKQKKIVKLVKL